MTVAQLKSILEDYNNDAEVIIVDWSNGREWNPSVGSDDLDEYTNYCRIGID